MLIVFQATVAFGQQKLPVIKAANEKAFIHDGDNVKMAWHLDPAAKPDVYYVNIPAKKSTVKLVTDQGSLIFHTQPNGSYPFLVILNEKDTCHIEIRSQLPPDLPKISIAGFRHSPLIIPFELRGSKIYLKGQLGQKEVMIQFDLGAGTGVVNKNASANLGLSFSSHTLVSNTSGVNKERTSQDNVLRIGNVEWRKVSFTEVGNMQPFEDIIIGNSFFRNKVIEINYDTKQFIVCDRLPAGLKGYRKLPVYYEQHRPMFKARICQNGRRYDHWFLFDTGRDGTMLLGEDFTGLDGNWVSLQPLMIINGRKIVRLDAEIAGISFKDIVTNAADPAKPNGCPSLFGNQLLGQFNLILDNINGKLYLKANSRLGEPYSDYKSYLKELEKNTQEHQ
jgi:hypothetical protein